MYLPNFMQVVQYFRKHSDYKINWDKSCLFPLGFNISTELHKELVFMISLNVLSIWEFTFPQILLSMWK